DRADIRDILAEDLDAESLLAATRPSGSADPASILASACANHEQTGHLDESPVRRQRGESSYRRLLAKAGRASSRGNVVRAAILRRRAVSAGAPDLADQIHSAAQKELTLLAERLRAPLGLSDEETAEWVTALPPLLEHAAQGLWPVEARFLYDLQKVCTEHE